MLRPGFPTLCVFYLAIASSRAFIVDLSHVHGPDTFMAGPSAPYNRTIILKGEFVPGVYIEMANLFTGEHGGTHIDAPSHFVEGGRTVDRIPLENLILDGVMIDCSKDVKANTGYIMPLQKLQDWEMWHGMIPPGAGVVINFGWSSRFNNPSEYVPKNDLGNVSFPSISAEAATWMIQERSIQLIAVDTMSPDLVDWSVHHTFLKARRTIVENVRDPGRLPPQGFRLHAVPVAFVGASGTQVRFYAITYDNEYFRSNGGQAISMVSVMFTTMSCFFFISFVRRMHFN